MRTGIDPARLLDDVDPSFVLSLVAATSERERSVAEQWTTQHELAALTLELLSHLRREFLLTRGVALTSLPPHVSVRRPGDDAEPEPEPEAVTVMSPRDFALMTAA